MKVIYFSVTMAQNGVIDFTKKTEENNNLNVSQVMTDLSELANDVTDLKHDDLYTFTEHLYCILKTLYVFYRLNRTMNVTNVFTDALILTELVLNFMRQSHAQPKHVTLEWHKSLTMIRVLMTLVDTTLNENYAKSDNTDRLIQRISSHVNQIQIKGGAILADQINVLTDFSQSACEVVKKIQKLTILIDPVTVRIRHLYNSFMGLTTYDIHDMNEYSKNLIITQVMVVLKDIFSNLSTHSYEENQQILEIIEKTIGVNSWLLTSTSAENQIWYHRFLIDRRDQLESDFTEVKHTLAAKSWLLKPAASRFTSSTIGQKLVHLNMGSFTHTNECSLCSAGDNKPRNFCVLDTCEHTFCVGCIEAWFVEK